MTPLLVGSGIFASWSDWQFRRLPNLFCLVLGTLGLGLTGLGQGADLLISHLAHLGIALVAGVALFSFGIIGGGDAKYYAAVASWFPMGSGIRLLAMVSLTGLFVTAFHHGFAQLHSNTGSEASEGEFTKVPFGIAIALGAAATAWSGQ